VRYGVQGWTPWWGHSPTPPLYSIAVVTAIVATWNNVVVGFIAFKRGNHLSLLFVRKEFSRQGIGRNLFLQCAKNLNEVTVNGAEEAVGFYQSVGFQKTGARFFIHGIWQTPMIWVNPDRS
jgi:GNAT superfamily N-acetyltransferase